jgi:hypothetical protein
LGLTVRFALNSGAKADILGLPLRATSGLMHRAAKRVTLSARAHSAYWAIPLSEGPQSAPSSLLARREQSMQIL